MYIEDCVKSLINQTYRNMEIIIVDDGSSDNTPQICDEIKRTNNKIKIIHKKNEGVIRARFDGAINARGKYVTFVDGDDWVDINAYKVLMEYNKIKQFDMVSFGAIRYWNKNNYYNSYDLFEEGIYNKEKLKTVYSSMLWNKDGQTFGMDPSICMKIFAKDKIIKYIDKVKELNVLYAQDVIILYPAMFEFNNICITHHAFYYHRQRMAGTKPQYLQDEKFFSKLLKVYDYLLPYFNKSAELMEQLDLFYIYSTHLKCVDNNQIVISDKWIFPFDKVKQDSTVAIFGYGKVGRIYIQQLKKIKYCNLCGVIDNAYDKYNNQECKIYPVEYLNNMKFDIIVIAIDNKFRAEQVRSMLIEKYGVDNDNIVI